MAKNNKDKQTKKKKSDDKVAYILTILITIILIAAMIFSYFYVENKNKETEVAYTDLIKQIDNKEVSEIEMTSGSTTAKVKYKGKENKEDIKVVSIPDTEAFTELIQNKVQKGNDIKLIQNLDKLLVDYTGMPVYVAEDPLDCVVKGAGKTLDDIDKLKTVFINSRKRK